MQTSVRTYLGSGKPGDFYDQSPRRVDPFTLVTSSSDAVAATGKIVFTAQPTANDTITIATVTYKFVSALAAANDVKLGTNLAATLASLVKAVNGTGTAGTDYYTGTKALSDVVVASGSSDTTLNLTAVTPGVSGNYINLASSDDNGTVTAFSGGVNGVSADAYVGYWFSVLATEPAKAQAGYVSGSSTGGILVNANEYANFNNLEASLRLHENSIGSLASMGRVIVKVDHNVTVGYLGCYNSATGSIGAAAASDSVPAGYTLIPNSKFILQNATANGLAILQLD